MTKELYEKTPSLSLRLRVPDAGQERKPTSNSLECHSSSFELIRVSDPDRTSRTPNELEYSRISSNKVEQRKDVAHG
jgi:hypothetical protein